MVGYVCPHSVSIRAPWVKSPVLIHLSYGGVERDTRFELVSSDWKSEVLGRYTNPPCASLCGLPATALRSMRASSALATLCPRRASIPLPLVKSQVLHPFSYGGIRGCISRALAVPVLRLHPTASYLPTRQTGLHAFRLPRLRPCLPCARVSALMSGHHPVLWTVGGSNSRPLICKTSALPAELTAHVGGCRAEPRT